MRRTILLVASLLASGCSTEAAKRNPADDGNVVFSLVGSTLETSMPGEYSSAGGSREKPLFVVAFEGAAAGLRVHQMGGGAGAVVAAESASDEPALSVSARARRRAATFSGGSVAIGGDGTLVLESIAKVPAAERITVERPAAVVVVEARAGAQRNELILPSPVEGQLLWVVNDDDDPVRLGDTLVGPGGAQALLRLGGRFRGTGPAPAEPAGRAP